MVLWGLSVDEVRKSFRKLIKAACTKVLVIPFICLLGYAALIIYVMTCSPSWKWLYLKDIIMWVLLVGVPVCYKAAEKKIEDNYFRNMLTDNIKWTAVLEFLMGSFTFSLIGELVLQLVMGFLLIIQSSCKQDKKAAQLKTVIDWIIAITGLVLIVLTVKLAIQTYTDLGVIDLIVSFSIPLVLSILYLPVAYCMAVFSKYNTIYVRMVCRNKDNTQILRRKKRMVLWCCGLSRKKLIAFDKWYTEYIRTIRSVNDDDAFLELVHKNFSNKKLEHILFVVKVLIRKAKVWLMIFIEHLRAVLSKCKLLIYVLICGLACICMHALIKENWESVKTVFEDPTLVGLLGTLLGAIIGGVFSILGSISVGKHQIKAQTQIRRKNVIYKPLYDELVEIHNVILKDNPYPQYIVFEKGSQTITRHPQFTVWGRIKADSRYLETPKKLGRLLDKLEADVREYLTCRSKVGNKTTEILNDVLMRELQTRCTIINIGDHLIPFVLRDSAFDLTWELHDSLNPKMEMDENTKQRIRDLFVSECKACEEVSQMQEKYVAWMQSEEDVIALLAAMIKQINAAYEE